MDSTNYAFGDPDKAPVVSKWTVEENFDSTPSSAVWNLGNWTNGSMFYCYWAPDHISYKDGIMTIRMDDVQSEKAKQDGSSIPYTSGEFRSNETFGYGYYEVRMKPCSYSGSNSSFFLYTKDDAKGIEWNEVDIEFLGKDTTQVQFNYFIDNKAEGHEFLYDLGFDASKEFHVYGIEYAEDHLSWFVDGKLAYRVDIENTKEKKLCVHPMQIMVNFWPGINVDSWLKKFTYNGPYKAQYDYIRFTPAEE